MNADHRFLAELLFFNTFAKKNTTVIFPENFEQKINFGQVREMLKDFCISSMGEMYVDKMRFVSRYALLKKWLGQVEEFRQVLLFGKPFPAQNYFNLIPELERISMPGTYLLQESLFDLKTSLQAIFDVLDYLHELDAEKFPLLRELHVDVNPDRRLLREAERIIDDRGNIRDNASDELQSIRTQLIRLSGEIDRSVRKVLLQARKNGWVNPNDEITVRNGRMVIPVPASNKRRIRGFIHDESATGQTVFIEPAEALEANNEIRELQNAEKREIVKILTAFTDSLRGETEELIAAYRFLGLIDFVRAKAKLALEFEAGYPILNEQPVVEWWEARHPLLYLAHKRQKKHVEPLSIKLLDDRRILVISGPNAGGKSVCLKTVGMLQYMLQCGLLIPVRETSEVGIFRDIFIDIGDEQSIENDLSTYTSHLRNMKYFSLKAGKKSLFLIDEFGTGTEPQLGGAIAEAVLEHLNKKGAYGVVTTHYANLKLLADKTPGLVNGAMLFDTRKMQPLFRLQIGNPGSSFAFEIARQTGFPWYILKNAEKKVGKSQLKFDQQLQQLELEKKEVIEKQKNISSTEKKLKELTEKYNAAMEKFEASRATMLKEARKEAAKIIDDSNRLVENTIREIKEAQAEKQQTRQLRERLKTEGERIDEKLQQAPEKPRKAAKPKSPKKKKEEGKILVGNRVRIPPQQTVGEVMEISGNEAVVSFGSMMMRLPLENLVNVGEEELHQKVLMRRSNYGSIINELNDKKAKFVHTLDLRGVRAEEAVSRLQKYIDEALLLSVKEVKILHGKGTGVLRDIIREQLRAIPDVQHFADEHVERGGSGITIVRLK